MLPSSETRWTHHVTSCNPALMQVDCKLEYPPSEVGAAGVAT